MTRRLVLAAATAFVLIASAIQAAPVEETVSLDGILNADTDDTLAFTPDGNTVFFDRSEGPHKTIMVARRVHGKWTASKVAAFSGHWFDQDPVIAPDGSYLLFNSDRPAAPGGKPLRQDFFRPGVPSPGSQLWRVDRKGAGWGAPVRLGPVINDDAFVDFASPAADGSLYYMRFDHQGRAMHIWRSARRGGAYQPPEPVLLGDPKVTTHDPAIAPDQSFIVFDYGKVAGGLGRLSIAFRQGAGWSPPLDLGDAINADKPWGAHLAPDGRTVYVTGDKGIHRISLEPWLSRRTDGAPRPASPAPP